MNQPRPESLEQYGTWLRETHRVELQQEERRYDMVSRKILDDVHDMLFWQRLPDCLQRCEEAYHLDTSYDLLLHRGTPKLLSKPWPSFLDKTFRKNVLLNDSWPCPPVGGWVLPGNWFQSIRDVVRTQIIVKYIDGVRRLVGSLSDLSSECRLDCDSDYEARDTGYYAAHVCVCHAVEIPCLNWETQQVHASLEIQVTTQLQDVIKRLLHNYYEDRRRKTELEHSPWQWQYDSDEFAANYLGHILHYVEGMIMDVRHRQERKP
ncbi:MAG: nucleotidyltransferase family protein [Anaerolineae bacterium]